MSTTHLLLVGQVLESPENVIKLLGAELISQLPKAGAQSVPTTQLTQHNACI